MTDDIVKQLREFDIFTDEIGTPWHPPICDKAADEIERLRKENDQLYALLAAQPPGTSP